jgi:thioredoxin reductase (NADPH)
MFVRSAEKIVSFKNYGGAYAKQKNITISDEPYCEVPGDEQEVTGVKALNKTTGETFEIPAVDFRRYWSQTEYRYF